MTGSHDPIFVVLSLLIAMLASYALSRTLTPIIIGLLLKGEHHGPPDDAATNVFARFHGAFERALKSGKPAILHCLLDPEAITAARTLTELREAALAKR